MTCYNCGYKISVVAKDDAGWLCEWCADRDEEDFYEPVTQKQIWKEKAEKWDKLSSNWEGKINLRNIQFIAVSEHNKENPVITEFSSYYENKIEILEQENKKLKEQLQRELDDNNKLRETTTKQFHEIEALKVYKARYEELAERYLHGTEKHFGELLTLYFEDEPLTKEGYCP